MEYGVALVLAISVGGTGLTTLASDISTQIGASCDAMETVASGTGAVSVECGA